MDQIVILNNLVSCHQMSESAVVCGIIKWFSERSCAASSNGSVFESVQRHYMNQCAVVCGIIEWFSVRECTASSNESMCGSVWHHLVSVFSPSQGTP